MQKRICLAILALLGVGFGFQNYSIYSGKTSMSSHRLSDRAMHGQKLWQQNNCFSCHQLFGLGGYLGPDLTNIASTPGKGAGYIKSMLNSGIRTMPVFHFTDAEKDAIAAYLTEVDATGYFPNHQAKIGADGWVELKYK